MKSRETKIELTIYNILSQDRCKLCKIRNIHLSRIDEHLDHLLKVIMDEDIK